MAASTQNRGAKVTADWHRVGIGGRYCRPVKLYGVNKPSELNDLSSDPLSVHTVLTKISTLRGGPSGGAIGPALLRSGLKLLHGQDRLFAGPLRAVPLSRTR